MTDIRLKRAYDEASPEDGQRLLVDRLWPRGLSREKAHLGAWLKEVAPSTELRKWFNHEVERWDEFQRRYRAELDANAEGMNALEQWVAKGPVTLVYSARDPQHNQAVVLKAYLQERLK